jgi:predicted nucleic acid-binding protein
MTTLVIDASVAVKWFVLEVCSDRALELLRDGNNRRIAPDLLFVEVATALSRRERLGEISAGQARGDLANLPLYLSEVASAAGLLDPAMTLSLDLKHPFTDCLYLALAVSRSAPLVTADAAFVAKLAGTAYAQNVVLLADWKP